MLTVDRREIHFHHPHQFLKLWISRPVPSSLMGMPRAKKQDRRLKHSQTHSSWPFLIASSHRFLIFDGLALDFCDKRNLSSSIGRVVVCRADSECFQCFIWSWSFIHRIVHYFLVNVFGLWYFKELYSPAKLLNAKQGSWGWGMDVKPDM